MSNVNSARLAFGFVVFALGATMALAQALVRPPYGNAVNLETAKKIATGAMAEAKKQKWNVAVAIVDNHGMLIYYEMQDDTQTAAADVSIQPFSGGTRSIRPCIASETGVIPSRNCTSHAGCLR